MFKKIVSSLPFSPALIEQVSFYAKRLRKEEITRRLGLIFMVLTLIVQSLVIFQPSESANAASQYDMVNGGISSLDEYLRFYDSNTKNLKDIMSYAGITRDEIASTKYSSWKVEKKLSWGFISHFSYADGERQHNITTKEGQIVTVYSRPLGLWLNTDSTIYGWYGYSQKIGWFGIMKNCGNLTTETLPTIAEPASPPLIIKTKVANNISSGFADATSLLAKANNRISYTISLSNIGGTISDSINFEDNLSDVLEYATLFDNGGGTLDIDTGILSWPPVTLKPGEKQTKTFIVKLLDPIPATAQGKSNELSFDCVMTNTFGDSTNVKVDCPAPKIIEQTVTQLPVTGPTENILFTSIIIAMISYFYARTRQLKKELFIIKRDAISGMI